MYKYVCLYWNWILDIDECNDVSLNKCFFLNLCVNVDGLYNCICFDFYILDNDGWMCKGNINCKIFLLFWNFIYL